MAKYTICKFRLTSERSIYFLKYLCEKYFDYEWKNENKLAQMLRSDIYYLTQLVNDGFRILNTEMEKRIARIRLNHHRYPLKYILQGELAEAREDAYRIFKEYISRTFKANKIEIEQTEFEEFLKFLDNNGMSIIYLTLRRSYYLPQDHRTAFTSFDYLSTLVIYFESFLKALMLYRKKCVSLNYFDEITSLKEMLNEFLKSEKWISNLKGTWKKKCKSVTNQDINLLVKEISTEILNYDKKINEILVMFLLLGVIRNYIAHDYFKIFTTIKNEQIFKSSIVGAIWYCWLKSNK